MLSVMLLGLLPLRITTGGRFRRYVGPPSRAPSYGQARATTLRRSTRKSRICTITRPASVHNIVRYYAHLDTS